MLRITIETDATAQVQPGLVSASSAPAAAADAGAGSVGGSADSQAPQAEDAGPPPTWLVRAIGAAMAAEKAVSGATSSGDGYAHGDALDAGGASET